MTQCYICGNYSHNKDNYVECNKQINKILNKQIKNISVQLIPFRQMGYNTSIKKYLEYANNPEIAIEKFIQQNHFNPNKPNRLNVLLNDKNDNNLQVFDYDDNNICRWQKKNKLDIIELLYDRGMNHLYFAKMILDGAGIKLTLSKENKLKKIIEKHNDEKYRQKCLTIILNMLYKYRNIVKINIY